MITEIKTLIERVKETQDVNLLKRLLTFILSSTLMLGDILIS